MGEAEHKPTTMLRVCVGAALDCCGREVLVPCDQCIDVAAWFAAECKSFDLKDRPECLRLWVGLRYRECPSDPAPVPRDPCGCDASGCAYTRVREAFELRLFAGDPPPCGDVFPPARELLGALSRDDMPAVERRGEELLERIQRLVAKGCPEPCRDEWLCLGALEAVLDCAAPAAPKIVDVRLTEDSGHCRKILLSSSALQVILLDLADAASAAGLFGIGPTIAGLRFEGYREREGILRIDVRLDHFQPDCAGCKRPITLFDRMIHALGTFRSARSCSSRGATWGRAFATGALDVPAELCASPSLRAGGGAMGKCDPANTAPHQLRAGPYQPSLGTGRPAFETRSLPRVTGVARADTDRGPSHAAAAAGAFRTKVRIGPS